MSEGSGASSRVVSIERTLHRLFLTLFLRGRSSRGLNKAAAPTSVGKKLGIVLGFYALFGLVAISLVGIVMWGTLSGSMLPFVLKRLGFDPAKSSAPPLMRASE